jgi:hypothetical protein
MTAEALRASSTKERVAWLAESAEALLQDALRESDVLASSSGLSAPMVEWGVRTTLETMHHDALRSLAASAHQAGGAPIGSLSVVLAGNLFTASARALIVPLLLGIPVVAKASSRETLFPEMIRDALRAVDPELGGAMKLLGFPREDAAAESALIEVSDATAVYGGDDTIGAIRQRHPDARLIRHGHGVSAAYCGPHSLGDDRIDASIAALALDIAAYDQRGCLSPQVVYVAETATCSAETFAERLAAEGMQRLERELPRGPLPLEVGAAQAQWRGVCEVEGQLIVGDGFAIAVQPLGPIRWSPGYRNVSVIPVRDTAGVVETMSPLGPTLKCVGADPSSLLELRRALDAEPSLSAYACPLGTMQTPPLDAPADGHPIWHGLLS